MNLKDKLAFFSKHSLSEDTRLRIKEENNRDSYSDEDSFTPPEFRDIAQVALAGYFGVCCGRKNIKVHPTCVEFYYHEEAEDGIKDYIVYHRNPKNSSEDKLKSIFSLGILHHHVSGIDITFEHGSCPEDAVRASMLIREFWVEGEDKPDNRSTLLYDALYSQTSVFDGFSIKWVDGEKEIEVASSVRKNVAKYDGNAQKLLAKEHQDLINEKGFSCTEDKKYIQDPRKWQFKKV